jgi:outer membrane protein TolC
MSNRIHARRWSTLVACMCFAGFAGVAAAQPLSLADAVRRASGEAPQVQIANYHAQGVGAREGVARAPLLPHVLADASQTRRSYNVNTFGIPFGDAGPLIGPFPVFDGRVHAVQTIADVSDWKRLSSAKAGTAASRADARTSTQQASETAALRYIDAARATATVAARRSDLGIASQLDTLSRAQLQAGTAANIDVLRTATALQTARGALSVAENARQRALIDLARALGADAGTVLDLTDTLGVAIASQAPEARDAAVRLALERRSELEAERQRQARARAERSAVKAEWIPRLDAAADYGASGSHLDDAIATSTATIGLTWPLFDGASRSARVAEQTAAIGESDVREHDLEQQVTAEVEGALLDVASGEEQEAIARERVDLAKQQLAEAELRFRNGIASTLETIDAQAALLRARDAEIAAQTTTANARIHLARATGVAETLRTP